MSEEHSVAIVSFEGALKREVKRIRKELQKVDSLSSMRIDIEVSGPVHSGDIRIQFCVGSGYGNNVKGDSLNACVDEFLRRNGWEAIHKAKLLTYEKIPSDDTNE